MFSNGCRMVAWCGCMGDKDKRWWPCVDKVWKVLVWVMWYTKYTKTKPADKREFKYWRFNLQPTKGISTDYNCAAPRPTSPSGRPSSSCCPTATPEPAAGRARTGPRYNCNYCIALWWVKLYIINITSTTDVQMVQMIMMELLDALIMTWPRWRQRDGCEVSLIVNIW